MSYILNIETATTVCSVAVCSNETLLVYKELDAGYTHAENLHLFIQEVLQQAGIVIGRLNAIAVSKGPGSYTGLRIGVSAAKGLAYALGIPLISVDTLQIMASQARHLMPEADFYCAMIDARRMEVYTAIYDKRLINIAATQALIVDPASLEPFNAYASLSFFGDGMPKCRGFLSTLKQAFFIEDVKPSARYMCSLAYKKFKENNFENTAYFEPFYLKDFFIKQKQ